MDLNHEVRTLVRQLVMDEINNLGGRAAIREKLNELGKSEAVLSQMIETTVDSYIRSVLGTNEEQLKANIEAKLDIAINKIAQREVEKIVGKMSSWKGSEAIEKMMLDSMRKIMHDNFQISVAVSKKQN